jgi:hypothetical protein
MDQRRRNYRIYARAPGCKNFKAMDMHRVVQVNKVSESTTYWDRTDEQANKLRAMCAELNADRPGWHFELRTVKT